jgi:hypothetical protein
MLINKICVLFVAIAFTHIALAQNASNTTTAELMFDNLTKHKSTHRGSKNTNYSFEYKNCTLYINKKDVIPGGSSTSSLTQYSIPLKKIENIRTNNSNNSITLKTKNKSKDIYKSFKKGNEKSIESNISWIPIQIQKNIVQTEELLKLLVQRCKNKS